MTYGCLNDIITKLIREKTILKNQKRIKKLLTRVNNYDILDKLFRTTEMIEADSEKRKIKKLLTSDCKCDNINKLSLRRQQRKRTLIIK